MILFSRPSMEAHRSLTKSFALEALVGDVVRSFGPRVYQDCLDLYFAPQALELCVLGKRRSRLIEADGVVGGLVALVSVFLCWVMNARLVPVNLEVLRNET